MLKRFVAQSPGTRAILILVSLVLMLLILILTCEFVNRITLGDTYRQMITSYPQLVIQRIKFSKYLVQGTLPDNDPHFAKLDIWLVRGSADIQFDLSNFAIDKRKTDYLNKILCLSLKGKAEFRTNVAVSIDPRDIRQVESVKPQSYTADELKKMATNAALAGGAAGSLAGGLAANGGLPATQGIPEKLLPVTKYSGGIKTLVGTAAGGALAAGTAYCFTDNFIEALQSTARQKISVMDMLSAAKPLLASELSGNDETNAVYRGAFETRIRAIASRAGWRGVVIDYGETR